jgi:hypothetical protein
MKVVNELSKMKLSVYPKKKDRFKNLPITFISKGGGYFC